MDRPRLPIHLAFYSLGSAKATSEGVLVRSEIGPLVECLANTVERVTVVAHDVVEVPRSSEDRVDYLARSPRQNIDVLSLGPPGDKWDYLTRSARVRRIVARASPDWDVLVLRYGRRANLILAGNRCPRLVTLVHGPPRSQERPEGSFARLAQGILVRRSEWHLRRALRSSALAITDGEECLRLYGRFSRGMHIVRDSARRARFSFTCADRLVSSARFLFVGYLSRQKGVLDAIEAFSDVMRTLPDARLEVVGDGPERGEAERRVERLGIEPFVDFKGWIPSGEGLFERYRSNDVLLFLSRSATESFPRVVTEAMAHSVLVVSTPVGSLSEVFRDGEEIRFVPIADPPAASRAVSELLRDHGRRRSMLAAGREWAEQATAEHASERILELVTKTWPELARARTDASQVDG